MRRQRGSVESFAANGRIDVAIDRGEIVGFRRSVLSRRSALTLWWAQELCAGEVACPVFVLLRCPAAVDDEQLPGVGVVDRPEDVRRLLDVELGSEVSSFVESLDDR